MLFWLLDNLKFGPNDTLWVGIQQELEAEYAMEARLQKEYPALDFRVVLVDFQTRGAAETLFIMLQVYTADGAGRAGCTFLKQTSIVSEFNAVLLDMAFYTRHGIKDVPYAT